MRHGRAKQARKTLQFFQRITNGAIRSPYSILLDGTFLVALVQYKLQEEMMSRLDRLLQHATMHLITTRSTLVELQKLEQAVGAKDAEKALVFRQARMWAESNCTRILENADIPDESTVDISTIPTTPASVMTAQQGANHNNNKGGRGGRRGGGGIRDVSVVGREFLRLVMAVLLQEDDEAKEKSAPTAAGTVVDEDSTKKGEGSNGTTKEDSNSRESLRRRDHSGKRNQHHQQQRHCYYFVASQDEQVLDRLRHLGHVPIVRLARGSVLLLEQPSKAATQQAWREERLKWRSGGASGAAAAGGATGNNNNNNGGTAASSMLQQERNEAQRLVKEERQERRREQQQQQAYTPRHKKRAKGPNPLSCKPGSKKKQKT